VGLFLAVAIATACWPQPQLIAIDNQPEGLAVDDGWAYYFTVDRTIARVPRHGGRAETLVTGVQAGTRLWVVGDTLFWHDAFRGTFERPLGTGAIRLLEQPAELPSPLEAEDARFRFHSDGISGEVWRIEKETGAARRIFDVQSAPWHDDLVIALASDGAHLFVSSQRWQEDQAHVGSVELDGRHPEQLDALTTAPHELVARDGSLWYRGLFNGHAAVARICPGASR
jgi:hypothetical protein